MLLTIISSLAEGADREVAEVLLQEENSRLLVPLPLPVDDYCQDFASSQSWQRSQTLLARATTVIEPPSNAIRPYAYRWAGQIMVEESDAIIAIWDGQAPRGPGGTAEIVAFALQHRRPVVQVPTSSEVPVRLLCSKSMPLADPIPVTAHSMRPLPWYLTLIGREIHRGSKLRPFAELAVALRDLDHYNRSHIGQHDETASTRMWDTFIGHNSSVDQPEGRPAADVIWEPIVSWLAPHFLHADRIALDAQRSFRRFFWSLYLLPVAAIATVTIQSQFFPTRAAILWIEVALLLGALALMSAERWTHWHRSWISSRHFAERLRCAFYLAPVDPPPRTRSHDRASWKPEHEELKVDLAQGTGEFEVHGFHATSGDWLHRAFAEVWQSRPLIKTGSGDLPVLRRVLADEWIGGQQVYHEYTTRFQGAAHRALTRLVWLIFAVTVCAALLHAVTGWTSGRGVHITDTLALALPALASGLLAASRQREHRRHEEQSREMERRLAYARTRVGAAGDLAELRRDSHAVEELIMNENRDWFGLMRLRVPEPHA